MRTELDISQSVTRVLSSPPIDPLRLGKRKWTGERTYSLRVLARLATTSAVELQYPARRKRKNNRHRSKKKKRIYGFFFFSPARVNVYNNVIVTENTVVQRAVRGRRGDGRRGRSAAKLDTISSMSLTHRESPLIPISRRTLVDSDGLLRATLTSCVLFYD